jgi:hypothetical protein
LPDEKAEELSFAALGEAHPGTAGLLMGVALRKEQLLTPQG